MENNFSCKYFSGQINFCYFLYREFIDKTRKSECNTCKMNNGCQYCREEMVILRRKCDTCEKGVEISGE